MHGEVFPGNQLPNNQNQNPTKTDKNN